MRTMVSPFEATKRHKALTILRLDDLEPVTFPLLVLVEIDGLGARSVLFQRVDAILRTGLAWCSFRTRR